MLRSFIRVNRLGGAQKSVGSNRGVLSTGVNNSFSLHSARNQFSTSTSSPITSSPYASIKSIGIIGGGVAGLQTAKILAARGFEVTIFESSPEVGGVWRKNYSGFGVQVPKELYEFHDFPFSAAAPGEFVAGPKVQKYILDYVHDAKLQDVIRTNTLVSKVEEDTTGLEGKQKGWKFHIKDATNGTSSTESFDFAVCATGMYSTKNFPEIKNISNFKGDYIHSTNFVDASIAKGKNVLVLGSAKSAIDCVLEAKKAGASQSILLARNAHWGTPRNIAGLIPFKYVFLSRFGQALVSWYKGAWPTAPSSVKVTHSALAVVMGPVFKIVEALFAFQLGLYGKMAPSSNTDVVKDFYGYAHVLDSSFKNALSSGSILVEKGSVGSVSDDGKGVVTTEGKVIPADVIVAGTGFKKSYEWMDSSITSKMKNEMQNDGLWLYKNLVHPDVPRLAFVGSEVATISNIATHAIQAEWLARLLTGRFALPKESIMKDEVEKQKTWARSWMPETPSRSSVVLLHQIHYHDSLFKEMGLQHRRKGMNVIGEIFMPYEPSDYKGIEKE